MRNFSDRLFRSKLAAGAAWLPFILLPAKMSAVSTSSAGKIGEGLQVPTPTPSPSLSPSPTNPVGPESPIVTFIKNIIGAIGLGFAPIIGEAERLLKLTPPIVAYNFPWLLLFYLLLLIILHTRQAIREEKEAKAILETLKREKAIAEEKENFIMLTSHHFRTWTTYIRNGIDLISANQNIDREVVKTLNDGSIVLAGKVEELLKTIDERKSLQELEAPDVAKARRRMYTSPFFIGPLVLVALIGLGANYLFTNLAKIQISVINQIIQILAYLVEGSALYLVLRSRLAKRTNVQNALNLLAHQRTIDEARTRFIHDSVIIVGGALEAFSTEVASIQDNDQAKYIVSGYQKLINLISKFQLAISVQGSQEGTVSSDKQHFTLKRLVEEIVGDHAKVAADKKIKISVSGFDGELIQNADRLRLVVASLIDNAIKFSPESGTVTVTYNYNVDNSTVSVTDSGPGMTKEQADRLFQPFTRTESALVFSYEGMGFSLYLDRLIMKYLSGDIAIDSKPGAGTTITISLASDLSNLETIVIEKERTKAPKVKISAGLIASTILLVITLIIILYLSSQGTIKGLLVAVWPLLGIFSIFVVGSWLAIMFGIIERDSRRK